MLRCAPERTVAGVLEGHSLTAWVSEVLVDTMRGELSRCYLRVDSVGFKQ